MKTKNINPGIFTAILLIFVFLISCNKKPDQVGLGLQPITAELSVVFDDSTGLFSHSVREDSVRTDAGVIQTGMVGSMMDPEFGRTTAGIITQLRLSENGQNFGSDPVLDSLVLSLRYSGFYGDTNSTQTIRVYELSEEMNADTAYYSNEMIANTGIEIGSLTFTPNLVDSVNVGGIMQLPQLRIRLTDEFALQIINADANVFDDNESWLAFMKGIYITADNAAAGGGIMLFDMFSTLTNLTIFYRTGDPQDTLSFSFLSNSNCARFTSFDHNSYSEASAGLQAQILNDDTAGGQQQIYLQGMGGVKAQIRLPDIESFFENGPVSINEAKLIFNIYDDGAELDAPPQLALAIIDEDGKYLPLPDANEVSSYFGGYLNEGKTQYFFRISRHVQQVLTGASPNYPLALLVSGASFRPQRTILYGPHQQNAELRMRLAVKYTKVN